MGGDALIPLLSGAGGAATGAILAPFTGGMSIPAMAAIGGGIGAGAGRAGTGGNLTQSLVSGGLGAAGGYGLGTLGAPLLAVEAGLPVGTGLSTAAAGSSVPGSLAATGTNLAGTSLMPGVAASGMSGSSSLLGPNTLQNAMLGTMLAGQLGALLNPQPMQISHGPVQGFSPPQIGNSMQQFMIPVQPSQPPVFRL